jgi:protein-disulfide isomerase-like protein with CxxC motif
VSGWLCAGTAPQPEASVPIDDYEFGMVKSGIRSGEDGAPMRRSRDRSVKFFDKKITDGTGIYPGNVLFI